MVNASWLYGWDECMENNIHANFHGWHGGAWDCAVDASTEYLDDKWDGQLDKGQLGFLGLPARAAWYQYAPSNNWTHCPRTLRATRRRTRAAASARRSSTSTR